MPHLVVFLTFPQSTLLDLSGPLQVFEDANRGLDDTARYDIRIISPSGGAVSSDTALPILSDPPVAIANQSIGTLIVVGGNHAHEISEDADNQALVRGLAARADRVASVCTGAFFLAGAGLLDHRKATTHWRAADILAKRHPDIDIDADPIFVRDGHLWTSAGVTSGIDLSLALVADDHGRTFALDLARELVTYMVRPGGQLQFSRVLSDQVSDADGAFDQLLVWLRDNLDVDLRVETLAEKVNMTPRTFARRFVDTFGQTPAKMVEMLRTDVAINLLVETDLPIKQIAVQCGFLDDERLRRALHRQFGISPQNYRARFGQVVSAPKQ